MFTARLFQVACVTALVGVLPSCSSSNDGPLLSNSGGTGGGFAGTGTTTAGDTSFGGTATTGGTFSDGSETAGTTATGGGGTAGDTTTGGGGTGGDSGGTASGTGGDTSAGTGGTGGAGGSGGSGGAATTAVTVQTATLGSVMADQDGMTLYVFGSDTHGTPPTSTCTADCLTNWPIFYQASITVPASLTASDFTAFDRGGGTMQTAYMGWPLYHYALDNAPGDTKGDGVGTWHAAKVPFTAPQ